MKHIITQIGLNELLQEYNQRKGEVREKIADEIEKAREQGDLSENAAYKSAMDSKAFNERRIDDLEKLIQNAEVQTSDFGNKCVDIGEKFVLVRQSDNKKFVYTLVGTNEADPSSGRISIDSPLGKSIRGKRYGDRVKVQQGANEVEFLVEKF